MYRYAATKNRVHRVIVENGKAFKVEQCNLDDVAFLHLDDIAPEGKHCAYCWAGWVEPTEEAKAKHAEEIEQFKETSTGSVPIVQSTRRMAIAALAGAALLGVALGVVASPDLTEAAIPEDNTQLADLQRRIDDLFVQVRTLSVDINGHTHEQAEPNVIVLPAPTIAPVVAPTSTPSEAPKPSVTPSGNRSSGDDSQTRTTNTTTIVVVPASEPTSPTPTAPPPKPTDPPSTPSPEVPLCERPGQATGAGDPCRWPHN